MLQRPTLNRRTRTAPSPATANAHPLASPTEPSAQPPGRTPLQTPPAGKGPPHAWPRKR